jgi:hypothetical protein
MSNRLYVKVKLEAFWYVLQIQDFVKDHLVKEMFGMLIRNRLVCLNSSSSERMHSPKSNFPMLGIQEF